MKKYEDKLKATAISYLGLILTLILIFLTN